MAKEEAMLFRGRVTEVLPGSKYRVQIENSAEHTVLEYLSGKMKQNRIQVIEGDSVDVEISPYDVTQGRIRFRHK